MVNGIFASSSIGALEQVAAFAEARHGLLAGNIANLDTPGYKTRDLSVENFQKSLREALEQQKAPPQYVSPGMIPSGSGDPMHAVKDATRNILFHDQSDVGLEEQVTELSNNQFMHSMAVALLSQQFRQLETAISERI